MVSVWDLIPFGSMRNLHEIYKSPDLFPLFANRLISKKRPEYKDFLRWLDLREDEAAPLVLLARTEGVRETDSLTVFPVPNETPKASTWFTFSVMGFDTYLKKLVFESIN